MKENSKKFMEALKEMYTPVGEPLVRDACLFCDIVNGRKILRITTVPVDRILALAYLYDVDIVRLFQLVLHRPMLSKRDFFPGGHNYLQFPAHCIRIYPIEEALEKLDASETP